MCIPELQRSGVRALELGRAGKPNLVVECEPCQVALDLGHGLSGKRVLFLMVVVPMALAVLD